MVPNRSPSSGNRGHVPPERPVTFLRNSRSRWAGIVGHVAPEYSIAAENAPAYFTFDLNLMFRPSSRRYSAGLFIRNVADRAYYTGGFQQPFSPGLFAANIGAPRTFG